MQKHALVIQDLSCVGRCSLLAALPVLNACGIRTTPLPTALLSTHTAFDAPHRLDLTQDMERTLDHWAGLPLRFDLIHIGYLAGAHQLPAVQRAVDAYHRDGALLCVDPAMGDWGRAYAYCDDALLSGFRSLCAQADLILPNRTEAALLLDTPYDKGPDSPYKLLHQLRALRERFGAATVITGVSEQDGFIGAACLARDMQAPRVRLGPHLKGAWPGTGDLFAAALEAAWLHGLPLEDACGLAVDFLHQCLLDAPQDHKEARYGVPFEPVLGWLLQRMNSR